jgi:hypothetical protein
MAGSRGLDWTLLYDEELPPPPAVLNRTFWICPVKDIEEIAVLLAGQRGRLHALAFAGPEARRVKLAEMLMPMGLTRLTSFGSLQNPPLTWPHGGTSPFKRFLSWTHLER